MFMPMVDVDDLKFDQSDEPEVRGIWLEVGGKPVPILLLFQLIVEKRKQLC